MHKFKSISGILNTLGLLLLILSPFMLLPLIFVLIYKEFLFCLVFIIPSGFCFIIGILLNKIFKAKKIYYLQSMLICGLAWVVLAFFACLPFFLLSFQMDVRENFTIIDAYFETVSGFTTTGITIFTDIEILPKSIIFYRSLIQWLGGLGILTLFLAITFKSNNAYFQLFSAESHKIDSSRPTPSIFKTAMILWGIYIILTFLEIIILSILGMKVFDSICHSLTTLSTGGFSPYNVSIDYYRQASYKNYKIMEYVITFFMFLGGMNFLMHFKLLQGRIKEIFKDIEFKVFLIIIFAFTFFIMLDNYWKNPYFFSFDIIEERFRHSIFTVVSIITTTGFGTTDINESFFPAMSKLILLISMVIGGCVGSTGGGIKVLRIVVLFKLFGKQLKRLRLPRHALSDVVIDGKIFPVSEIKRITGLFFGWIFLILVGGFITAFFTKLDGFASLSGMFSALGNIGPCYFSVAEMAKLPIIVKLTYTFGMLAGRLEILPILLIFNYKAWLG